MAGKLNVGYYFMASSGLGIDCGCPFCLFLAGMGQMRPMAPGLLAPPGMMPPPMGMPPGKTSVQHDMCLLSYSRYLANLLLIGK